MARLGDTISLAAALGFAVYTVTNKRLLARYSVTVVMTSTLTIGAVPALVLSLPTMFTQDWNRLTLLGWSALAWTVVVGVYLAWTLWNWVVAHMGAARPAAFMYLVPVMSGIVSWLFLGEDVGLLKVMGALIILSGLALGQWARERLVATKRVAEQDQEKPTCRGRGAAEGTSDTPQTMDVSPETPRAPYHMVES